MKIISIITALLFISLQPAAQISKLFCFEQSINGGAMRSDDNEIARGTANSGELNRYFVFAEVKKKSQIVFTDLWIKGLCYTFKTDSVKKLPFVFTTSSGGELVFTDTLVRSSSQQVIQLHSIVANPGKSIPAGIKQKILLNSVVLCYKIKNQPLFFSLKNIKKLRPLFTQ